MTLLQICQIISDAVSSKLGVPSDRFYLSVGLEDAYAVIACRSCKT